MNDNRVAVGLVNGISKIPLQIEEWQMCPPDSNTYRFHGSQINDQDLMSKSFKNIISPALGFLQRGGGSVIVEFNGDGCFRFIRGSENKMNLHQC
jgi:hypothetical protein